ncbi:Up-regulated during septation-domain-containing protein [Chaetomium strumarium]|uniref:Up-regulated during septation-domain-containing protein n=1 Tax=Chaetomium strumarium TaxID=1170767 RepID=A0AAJ0GQ40_9PEZI|nr:Up-regulated during septation-domain-containing protein [Chaetomium strumarium]
MNGAATRRGGSAGGAVGQSFNGFTPPGRMLPPGGPPAVTPTAKALVEGYRKDIFSGFAKERPQSIPSDENRPQSSALVDLKDPIQVHLLTETALSDSRTFEILSQEEVDDLKKQIQSLSMRIEQARANLAIQSKYRDAAISMAKLYSPSKADGKRRSLLSNRMSDSAAKEAEMERQASERRCEELAAELFSLEKRLMEPQRRLLQHTAGILQMTHRASSKKSGPVPVTPMMNGIPSSPESLYTYTNTRNSMEIPSDELDFNDRSLYLPLDQPEGPGARRRKNTIEIPLKSPIREQNAQLRDLREELEKVKEENERIMEENMQLKTAEQHKLREDEARARDEISRLQSREQELREEHAKALEESSRIRSETSQLMDETSRLKDADSRLKAIEQHMSAETEALRAQITSQLRTISDTEAKLEVLNSKLRDVIVGFHPTKNGTYGGPGVAAGSGETLPGQLEYLERGLATALEEQKLYAAEASRAAEDAAAEASAMASSLSQVEASLDQASARVQALTRQVQAVLQQTGSSLPAPAEADLDQQLEYLEESLRALESELGKAREASSSASAKKQNIEQVDAVLMGLWEIIQTGYAEIEQQRAARRQNRALGQGGDDDDELSSNEFEGDTNEPYSLQAFSTKVQWLYAQATGLREQKYILQRQIKQQRELNNRSESEKDRELKAKSDELEQTHHLLDEAERAAQEAQTQLQRVLADMDTLQKTTAANEAASASSTKAIQDQLKERTARIAALESEVREAESRLATAEANTSATQSQLQQSNSARTAAEAELATLQSQLASATEAANTASAEVSKLQQELQSKDAELESMNTMVIELKTEVAFTKAELDGAYGSRKQRAAEAAAAANNSNNNNNGNTEELNQQIVRLRAELENALRDLEEITRESIAAERDRLEIESKLDEVVGVKSDLEAEVGSLRDRLARAQEELDKERLKPAAAGTRGGAGASMLSEQFRGMMKEERRKFQEELKVSFLFSFSLVVLTGLETGREKERSILMIAFFFSFLQEEQAKRRKLEDELRSMRRGGLSPLQATRASTARGTLSPR